MCDAQQQSNHLHLIRWCHKAPELAQQPRNARTGYPPLDSSQGTADKQGSVTPTIVYFESQHQVKTAAKHQEAAASAEPPAAQFPNNPPAFKSTTHTTPDTQHRVAKLPLYTRKLQSVAGPSQTDHGADQHAVRRCCRARAHRHQPALIHEQDVHSTITKFRSHCTTGPKYASTSTADNALLDTAISIRSHVASANTRGHASQQQDNVQPKQHQVSVQFTASSTTSVLLCTCSQLLLQQLQKISRSSCRWAWREGPY